MTTNQYTESGKRIILFDASIYKVSTCMLRMYNTYHRNLTREIQVDNYTPSSTTEEASNNTDSHAASYGSAFHIFAKNYREKHSVSESVMRAVEFYQHPSIVLPPGAWRTANHLTTTCLDYADHTVNDTLEVLKDSEGKYLTEQRFAWPYLETEKHVFMLAGTIDLLCKRNEIVCFCDYKTTAKYDKDTFIEEYYLSPQLMFYTYVLNILARHFPDKFGQCGGNIPCFVEAIFLHRTKPSVVVRSDLISFSERQLETFGIALTSRLQQISKALETEDSPHYLADYTQCYAGYPCPFTLLCSSSDEYTYNKYLSMNYTTRKPYNPMTHGEHK